MVLNVSPEYSTQVHVYRSGPGFALEAATFLHGVQHFLSLALSHSSLLLKNLLQCITHCCGHLLGIPEHRKSRYVELYIHN